jgi:hypothetical protein
MYCSTCGNKIAENLNYCNSCGSRIEKNPLIIGNSSSPQLARSLGIVTIAGLLGFIAVLKLLLDNGGGLDVPAKVMILLGYLASVVIIAAMMIGHMWKSSGDIRIRHRDLATADDQPSPVSFRRVNTAQLEPAGEPGISVTEHTTRTLDEVAVRRQRT